MVLLGSLIDDTHSQITPTLKILTVYNAVGPNKMDQCTTLLTVERDLHV